MSAEKGQSEVSTEFDSNIIEDDSKKFEVSEKERELKILNQSLDQTRRIKTRLLEHDPAYKDLDRRMQIVKVRQETWDSLAVAEYENIIFIIKNALKFIKDDRDHLEIVETHIHSLNNLANIVMERANNVLKMTFKSAPDETKSNTRVLQMTSQLKPMKLSIAEAEAKLCTLQAEEAAIIPELRHLAEDEALINQHAALIIIQLNPLLKELSMLEKNLLETTDSIQKLNLEETLIDQQLCQVERRSLSGASIVCNEEGGECYEMVDVLREIQEASIWLRTRCNQLILVHQNRCRYIGCAPNLPHENSELDEEYQSTRDLISQYESIPGGLQMFELHKTLYNEDTEPLPAHIIPESEMTKEQLSVFHKNELELLKRIAEDANKVSQKCAYMVSKIIGEKEINEKEIENQIISLMIQKERLRISRSNPEKLKKKIKSQLDSLCIPYCQWMEQFEDKTRPLADISAKQERLVSRMKLIPAEREICVTCLQRLHRICDPLIFEKRTLQSLIADKDDQVPELSIIGVDIPLMTEECVKLEDQLIQMQGRVFEARSSVSCLRTELAKAMIRNPYDSLLKEIQLQIKQTELVILDNAALSPSDLLETQVNRTIESGCRLLSIEKGYSPTEDMPRAVMEAEDKSRIIFQTNPEGVSRLIESIMKSQFKTASNN